MSVEAPATIEEIHSWVLSEEGQRRIRRALERRRLPMALDTDIEEAVLAEAARYLRGGGVVQSASGWCSARITARSIDLARGVIRKEGVLGRPVGEEVALADEGAERADEALPANGALGAVREAVLESSATNEEISAALTVVSVVADEAEPSRKCPRPEAGANALDAACWAGLWYAGRDECFGSGNTVTKRRSRAAQRVKALLAQAAGGVR